MAMRSDRVHVHDVLRSLLSALELSLNINFVFIVQLHGMVAKAACAKVQERKSNFLTKVPSRAQCNERKNSNM